MSKMKFKLEDEDIIQLEKDQENQTITKHQIRNSKFTMQSFNTNKGFEICSIVYCVTSQSIILASSKKDIQVWKKNPENQKYEEFSSLEGHMSLVKALVLSQKTNTLFSGSNDYQLIIWKLKENDGIFTYRRDQVFKTDSRGIECLALNQKDNIVFVGTNNSKIFVFKRNEISKKYEESQVIVGTTKSKKDSLDYKFDDFEDIKYPVTSMSFSEKHNILFVAAQEDCIFVYGKQNNGCNQSKYSFLYKLEVNLRKKSSIFNVLYIPSVDAILGTNQNNQVILWSNTNGDAQGEDDYHNYSEQHHEIPTYKYDHFIDNLYCSHSQSIVLCERLYNVVIAGDSNGLIKYNEDVMSSANIENYYVDKIMHLGSVAAMYYCEVSNQLFSACDSFCVRVRQFEDDGTGVRELDDQEEVEYDDFQEILDKKKEENQKNENLRLEELKKEIDWLKMENKTKEEQEMKERAALQIIESQNIEKNQRNVELNNQKIRQEADYRQQMYQKQIQKNQNQIKKIYSLQSNVL